ncbi:hypothetical protein AAG906_018139 [Vitis piasezkii]
MNFISSMPSPVYQSRKTFPLNRVVNCSFIRLNISWIEAEPLGGMSQTLDLTMLGIKSKHEEFLFWTLVTCSSTSLEIILPLNTVEAMR